MSTTTHPRVRSRVALGLAIAAGLLLGLLLGLLAGSQLPASDRAAAPVGGWSAGESER